MASPVDGLVTHSYDDQSRNAGTRDESLLFRRHLGERCQGLDGSGPAADGRETSRGQHAAGGHPEGAERLLGKEETVFPQVFSTVLLFGVVLFVPSR